MEQLKSLSDPMLSSANSLDACTAPSTESGDICGERSGLQILDEFRRLYETRIASINCDDSNALRVKMNIMEEWIRDLDAQNVMLVKTVQELEEAAYQRVKILEDKLKQTSQLITENMTRFEEPTHHRLNDITERLDYLEHEKSFFKQKISNLQNDIAGLLELVKRGYYEGRWSLQGINLCELKDTDLPIPFSEDEPRDDPPTKKDLTEHDEFNLLSEDEKIMSSQTSESKTTVEHHQLELTNLQDELQRKHKEVERLKNHLTCVEKEALEAREALTVEVAEKHDQTIMLKDQMANLEEQCRQTAMQMQFKDDIIKEMRNQLKQSKKKEPSPSPTVQSKKSTGVTWGEVSTCEESYQKKNPSDKVLGYLPTLKNMENERSELTEAKNILAEILKTLNFHEKRAYEKGLADAHRKLQDMGNLLENYKTQSTEENSDCNTFINNTSKLTEAITIISKICLEKENGIDQLKLIVKNFDDCNNQGDSIEGREPSMFPNKPPEVCRQDFNAMEEFRVCTVEAQATVEDLQEEMVALVANLSSRHQKFTEVKISLEKNHQEFAKTNDDWLNVITRLGDDIEEKLISKRTILEGGVRLKDFKNDMNECLSKFNSRSHNETSTDQEKLSARKLSTAFTSGDNFSTSFMDKVVDEVDYILCNIQVLISKEDSTCKLLLKCKDQLHRVNSNLDELKKFYDRVLRDENFAKDVYEERLTKVQKLERELDDAHTRMQDNLEDIVRRSQEYESCRYDESPDCVGGEIERLRGIVTSKDKLIEHKDEIIRIQKDSIHVTQEEMKHLQKKMQKKIDVNVASINQHLEENKHLLEQSKLQNETIEHLREALVDAKKCLDRQCGQKSLADVWTSITPAVFNNGDVHDI
ncbi:uncharacterized protein LOC135160577 isoform X2 [Diachasmimorpha longicaudata]|uniref:uncharacterized protein LOC135160577 isoform X2 n=1 Tax=Diachasmimorpha longicaudata TaxID=58733 RepID=UPI0030B91659